MAGHSKLLRLFREQGQSPWLDNLKRGYLTSGGLARMVDDGIRGITSNPTIFQKAISAGTDYDNQFEALTQRHASIEDAYWSLVISDIEHALQVLRPVYDESAGGDGFVSIELAPSLARDTEGSIAAARDLHRLIDRPNLLVKIPGTAEGIPAIRQMIAEGRNINITLIFSLERYADVIEAYFSGLETYDGDLAHVHSVASFFVSRVDTEVDRRLQAIGTPDAQAMLGKAAVAQAKLAYQLFHERFSGVRWQRLADRGAKVQRPLWASTSTKNPDYSDTLYVDNLIGPDTINTMPETTIEAFEDHGRLVRAIDEGVDEAADVMARLAALGIDIRDVGRVLEEEGVSTFAKSFDELIEALRAKADAL